MIDRKNLGPGRSIALAVVLLAFISGCSSGAPSGSSPPVPHETPASIDSPTPKATEIATPDIRPPWFAMACEGTSSLATALDDFVNAVDRMARGDEQDVLDWVSNSRRALDDAKSAIKKAPKWALAARFVQDFSDLVEQLSSGLDEIENEPLGKFPEAQFRAVIDARQALYMEGAHVSAESGGVGCSMADVLR